MTHRDLEVTKSGGRIDGLRVHFTVVFKTQHLNDEDITELCEQADSLLTWVDICEYLKRRIHLLIKNGRTVAMIHYTYEHGLRKQELDIIEHDCGQIVQQLAILISVFEDP